MHEGLDWEAVCFHRDIKSANVCLDADFTVRVIDCGLSKYIEESEESFSSAGGIGTKGYICPDYNDGEINYESSCDVFSYGVFLCELITGKTSPSGRHGHYIAFEKKKTKALIDNVDATVEWDDDTCGRLVELALECIKSHSERRPTIGNVVERLHKIVYSDNMPNDDSVCTGNQFLSDGPKCRICGREGTKSYHCFGSTKHVHCGECLEDGLVRSMVRGEPHKFCCLKEGCDSRDFLIEEVEQYISRHTLVLYSLSSTVAGLKSMLHSMSSSKNESVGNTLRLQAQLCAGNGLPCPRRFILIEADHDGVHPWRNPREWLRNAKCVNLFLYFVCSHSNELVSDESRIKLRYTYEDLMKIAPAYNASLYLLQQTTAIVTGAGISLDSFKLKQMDEWSRELLDPTDRDVLDRARANGNMMKDSDARQLIGPALSLIAEKAVEKENLSWRRELTEALDFQEKEATFIKRDYQLESRYREWHKQPSHQLGVAGAPNPERVWPQHPPMTDAIQRILTCPISGDIMQDPVILFPSGKTYDRKSICTWLLRNPTPRDPWTNEPLDRHMTYVENREIRETLIYYLGEEAYKQYDDADFKLRYKALWNAHHVESLFNVGVSYQDDDQFDVAVEYYEQAAAEGHAGAQYNLAMLNEDNHERMLRCLEQAAAQDHPDALFYLGSLYYSSDVVQQDLNRAQECFQRAAAQGNNEALEALRDLPESTNVDEGHE
jgi:tetratricopeptide (TPR) repeat protein